MLTLINASERQRKQFTTKCFEQMYNNNNKNLLVTLINTPLRLESQERMLDRGHFLLHQDTCQTRQHAQKYSLHLAKAQSGIHVKCPQEQCNLHLYKTIFVRNLRSTSLSTGVIVLFPLHCLNWFALL